MKFSFYNPVKVVFGVDEVEKAGVEGKSLGSRAMILSYEEHHEIKEVLSKVENLLSGENIELVKMYSVMTNPELDQAEKIIETVKKEKVDFLVGIGGGSVMDMTKIIAAGVCYHGNLWEMFVSSNDGSKTLKPPAAALPIMLIPTLPATSSEMNSAAVLTNPKTKVKGYVFNDLLYPKISIIDPRLTVTLPNHLTASGGIDAISHNLEPYFNAKSDYPVQFRLEEAVVETLLDLLPKVIKEPENVDLRAHLQWAVLVSHNGWMKSGVAYFSSIHLIAHPLSSRFGIHHGAAMALILPAWMRYVCNQRVPKFVAFAERFFRIDNLGKEQEEIALEGIEHFESFIRSIGVSVKISEHEKCKISEDDLLLLTEDACRLGFNSDGYMDGNPSLTREDVYNIYKLAF